MTIHEPALAKSESKYAELENICAFKTAALTLAQKQLADGETALAKARADERERCAITAAKAVQDWIDQRKLFEMERAEMKPPYAHPEPSPLREFVASAKAASPRPIERVPDQDALKAANDAFVKWANEPKGTDKFGPVWKAIQVYFAALPPDGMVVPVERGVLLAARSEINRQAEKSSEHSNAIFVALVAKIDAALASAPVSGVAGECRRLQRDHYRSQVETLTRQLGEARAKERERCAKVCGEMAAKLANQAAHAADGEWACVFGYQEIAVEECETRIRALSDTQETG